MDKVNDKVAAFGDRKTLYDEDYDISIAKSFFIIARHVSNTDTSTGTQTLVPTTAGGVLFSTTRLWVKHTLGQENVQHFICYDLVFLIICKIYFLFLLSKRWTRREYAKKVITLAAMEFAARHRSFHFG